MVDWVTGFIGTLLPAAVVSRRGARRMARGWYRLRSRLRVRPAW
jgi:hypothetical protein